VPLIHSLPQAQYQTVSIASGFSNVIHAAVQPNGNVIAVTSCGIAPSTGNLWAVHPKLEVLSDKDWGQAKAAFSNTSKQARDPSDPNTEVCVIKDNKVHRMQPRVGATAALRMHLRAAEPLSLRVGINGDEEIEGDVVAACGTGGVGFFLATSTATFDTFTDPAALVKSGGYLQGRLYLCSIDTGAAILVHAHGPWGDVVSMVYHGGELIAFGGNNVIEVTKVLPPARAPFLPLMS